ncbi:MAG TPA: Arc family DNA-binding protein [Rhizomicrobium sp.]|jgi:plasmid stability protein
MATLTIRNLPEDVRDQLRREAAEHRRSMEEEARQTLAERYRKRLSPKEIIRRLHRLNSDSSSGRRTKMPASESLIASRRIEALYDDGLISRVEKASWDERIGECRVSLAEIERFAAGKRNWPVKRS